jgi:hypothetical protein
MGLDIYVGSFTRYYAQDWETVVQKVGREHGHPVTVIRQTTAEAITDQAQIRPAIVAWRDGLNAGLGDNLDAPLDWDEAESAPYFTDKPTWDAYSSLLLWAAYAENQDLARPHAYVEDLESDPAYRRSREPGFKTAYSQLIRGAEVWLPARFDFTFTAQDPAGNEVVFGSSVALADQLELLNQRTWNASNGSILEWRFGGADYQAPLEIGARFAFAVLRDLARHANTHRLIMKLDY